MASATGTPRMPTQGSCRPFVITSTFFPSRSIDWRGVRIDDVGLIATRTTIFWPDDGLDTGPILLQKECAILQDETLGELYFNKLFPMGIDALEESIKLVRDNSAERIEQDLDKGSYESWFGKASAEIDWSKPATDVYNMIRAANPAPGAWTTIVGDELKIYDSARVDGTGITGEVVSVGGDGVTVQAEGGRILIKRVRPAGGGKMAASDWAAAVGINSGTKLGS